MKYQFNSARCDGQELIIEEDGPTSNHSSPALVLTIRNKHEEPYHEILLRAWQVKELITSLREWFYKQEPLEDV